MPDERAAYRRELRRRQKALARLVRRAAVLRQRIVVVFEGWDASGKSGTIRRLVRGLEPGTYTVVPVAAPTRAEARHGFLWRFRRQLRSPRTLTVFDRSWYGRVLFERVEGLVTPRQLAGAYRDIRAFEERELTGPGRCLLKFWLQVSPAEQRARLVRRARDPSKRHRLSAHDWKNLAQREAYERALEDVFRLTGGGRTPWTRLDANDKRRLRLAALERVARGLRGLGGVAAD